MSTNPIYSYISYFLLFLLGLIVLVEIISLKTSSNDLSFVLSNHSHTVMKSLGGVLICSEEQLRPSPEVPTNVNKVRPADIKIIAALGDSITIGSRSHNYADDELRLRHPGNSFSTGADEPLEKHITLANILRKFSPMLRGVSLGSSEDHLGFNVALSGNTSRNLPEQATTLVERMKNSDVDIANDWKLITLFIGTNDVGDLSCVKEEPPIPKYEYKKNIERALAILKASLPRSIVAILPMWHPEFAIEAKRFIKPELIWKNCTSDDETVLLLSNLCDEYRAVAYEIQNERKFHDETFTVVVQGFVDDYKDAFRNSTGVYDPSFYAWDTFHLSKYGNAVLAKAFWNSMLQPVGKKDHRVNLGNDSTEIVCPTEKRPFIYTIDNSSEDFYRS